MGGIGDMDGCGGGRYGIVFEKRSRFKNEGVLCPLPNMHKGKFYMLSLQAKKINKHDRTEVFPTDIHGKKSCSSTMYKLCFCSQKECWKCIFWQSGDLNFKNCSFSAHHGDTSRR